MGFNSNIGYNNLIIITCYVFYEIRFLDSVTFIHQNPLEKSIDEPSRKLVTDFRVMRKLMFFDFYFYL